MDYNPFLPEVKANPYPYYAELRRAAPVYQVPGVGFWVVSRYDDVFAILKNPQVFSSVGFTEALVGDLNPFSPEAPSMIASDPPYHTRLRKLVNRAFTPRRVASLEAHLREMVQQLIERMAAQGTCDLIRDLAIPLPVMAIAELLGVSPERYQDFKRWMDDIVRGSNGSAVTAEERAQVRQSTAELRAYFQAAIENSRKHPGDNLLSDLVRAEEEQQQLTSEEILSLALLVLAGGAETTTNLIGNAMLALFDHPEQLAKVRANPTLIPNLVEEVLRYDAPIQWLPRLATRNVEIAGTTVPAGAVVLPIYGSANRDEHKFPDPDRFDIQRNTDGLLAFGFGIHFCLGAQLARLEAKLAFETLLGRLPHLSRADEQYIRVDLPLFRGVKTLPLAVA